MDDTLVAWKNVNQTFLMTVSKLQRQSAPMVEVAAADHGQLYIDQLSELLLISHLSSTGWNNTK